MATGNRMALYARSLFQSLLFSLGSFVHNWAWSVVIVGLGAYLICSFGLQYVHIETDLMKLWVSRRFLCLLFIFSLCTCHTFDKVGMHLCQKHFWLSLRLMLFVSYTLYRTLTVIKITFNKFTSGSFIRNVWGM